MGDAGREMGIPSKNQKEIPESKNAVPGMKSAFDGLFNRPDTTKERIGEIEKMSIEASKTYMQREIMKKTTEYPRTIYIYIVTFAIYIAIYILDMIIYI